VAWEKIGTALLKHQVKKLVGEDALGAIGEELADIRGEKFDEWLGDKSTFEELEKVVVSFISRSRNAGGGSGIGPTIARHFIEAHDGNIWAESMGDGQGSTFTFSLKVTKE